MRWNRATASVCVYENTCPTCNAPLTVGGGVSIEYTSPRPLARSNRYVPPASHRADHLSSNPSSEGFSGTCMRGVYEPALNPLVATPRTTRIVDPACW